MLKPLLNSLFRHSGLDPESRQCLKTLVTGLRRYDYVAGWAEAKILLYFEQTSLIIL